MRLQAACVVAFVALFSFPGYLEAQLGCSGARCTVEIAMPVNDVLRVSLSSSSATLGTPAESDYTAGFRDVVGVAVQISAKANRAFVVQIGGVTPAFSYSGALPDPTKPASDLRWATSSAGLPGTANHMGAAGTLISRGAGTVTVPLYLRTLWSFTSDVPGLYSLGVRFTISAP